MPFSLSGQLTIPPRLLVTTTPATRTGGSPLPPPPPSPTRASPPRPPLPPPPTGSTRGPGRTCEPRRKRDSGPKEPERVSREEMRYSDRHSRALLSGLAAENRHFFYTIRKNTDMLFSQLSFNTAASFVRMFSLEKQTSFTQSGCRTKSRQQFFFCNSTPIKSLQKTIFFLLRGKGTDLPSDTNKRSTSILPSTTMYLPCTYYYYTTKAVTRGIYSPTGLLSLRA